MADVIGRAASMPDAPRPDYSAFKLPQTSKLPGDTTETGSGFVAHRKARRRYRPADA